MTNEERDFILLACAKYLLGYDTTHDGCSSRVGCDTADALRIIIKNNELTDFRDIYSAVEEIRAKQEHEKWKEACKATRKRLADCPEYIPKEV